MHRLQKTAVAAVLAVGLTAAARAQAPLGTGVTYQGHLKDTLGPLNGSFDLTFTLWDAPGAGSPPVGGLQIGAADSNPATAVADGLFTVQLNDTGQFGPTAFTGSARWLQVSVNGTVLGPRQAVTAAPYALYALNAPSSSGFWQAVGSAITNTNTGFVGVNRPSTVSGAEYFGIQAPVAAGYGGMYIRTDGANALPFYGYKSGPTGNAAWTYLDGASGAWRLNVDGDRVTVTETGDMGIGTTAPLARLSVETPTTNAANNTARFYAPNLGPNTSHIHYGPNGDWYIRSASAAGKLVLQDTGGNVGVGTSTPSTGTKLDILGPDDGSSSTAFFALRAQTGDPQGYAGVFRGLSGAGPALWAIGSVRIGTAQTPAGVKLSVDGKVLCEELEVQLAADWPDYVFADGYELMSLEQVSAYVREHRHLPDVPSAARIRAEGINVGEMNATLLRKVEELTLHMIALDRRVQALTEENERLRAPRGVPTSLRPTEVTP